MPISRLSISLANKRRPLGRRNLREMMPKTDLSLMLLVSSNDRSGEP